MSDDDMTIYIPTYRRVDNQVTWANLSDHWRARAFLVAVPDEVAALEERGYRVLSCPVKGIGKTRQWILEQHDLDLMGDRITMMDDDLAFYIRREDDPTKFSQMRDRKDFDTMMAKFVYMMDHVAIGGISNRSGANRDTQPYRHSARLHDLLGINARVAREEGFRTDGVQFMEDFDLVIQFLAAGYPMLCLNTYCKGDRGSNVEGGCSEYRDLEGQERAARDLKSRWPDHVALTTRPGWNGAMDAPRTDVRVQWGKLLQDGIAGREFLGRALESAYTWDAQGTLTPLN